jgi:hypothetical protein
MVLDLYRLRSRRFEINELAFIWLASALDQIEATLRD